ncbi:class I SAM-dependent methyltransferase [Xanthobacter sp. TB0139]|uniref:class I SAM-dependent methyltransferase n=1 Tax=Xanthobacter sp. TB0139 TaxID=3459178 RepID=UPI00403912B3
MDDVKRHYGDGADLATTIADTLQAAGKSPDQLSTTDLRAVDEFHIRGHKATLELAAAMKLTPESHVLDIGSGLGGPARALAESCGCHVTGIDLTQAYCDTANMLSTWVKLDKRTEFQQADATCLPFADASFDAAMTIHVAMNIPDKAAMYAQAKRVLKPGGRFVIYDVLQGEGGDVQFPVPWAREPSISHLETPEAMAGLLTQAGFRILETRDSTAESLQWFERTTAPSAGRVAPPVTLRHVLGDDFPQMVRNQIHNLRERRILTVTFVCEA